MAESIQDKIRRSLEAAESLYHRLVLLVGDSGSGKTDVLRDVASDYDTSVFNVNLVLSAELLELTAKQRAVRLPEILDRITPKVNSPVILDNIEILFEKDLMQDPLRLLQGISRNHTLIAAWNGTVINGKLMYAEMGHPEYRCYDSVDALIVNTDGTYTVDPV